MKKQNNSKLIKVYEGGQFKTELWWNDETKQFDIWRNKKVVYRLTYKGFVLFEDMVNQAIIECNEWYDDTETKNMTLNEYLQRNNLQLTDIELKCLNTIFSEGSFYEEGCMYIQNDDGTYDYDRPYVDRKGGSFIGWYIDEKEVPGCRGALSSLQKKGILTIAYDDSFGDGPQAMYYIHFTPEFLPKGNGYHALDIHKENRRA